MALVRSIDGVETAVAAARAAAVTTARDAVLHGRPAESPPHFPAPLAPPPQPAHPETPARYGSGPSAARNTPAALSPRVCLCCHVFAHRAASFPAPAALISAPRQEVTCAQI